LDPPDVGPEEIDPGPPMTQERTRYTGIDVMDPMSAVAILNYLDAEEPRHAEDIYDRLTGVVQDRIFDQTHRNCWTEGVHPNAGFVGDGEPLL
jgi:hypothetical protein